MQLNIFALTSVKESKIKVLQIKRYDIEFQVKGEKVFHSWPKYHENSLHR